MTDTDIVSLQSMEVHIRSNAWLNARLKQISKEKGFGSIGDLLTHWTIVWAQDAYPSPSGEDVMRDSVPCFITGLPGSGKTFFTKSLVTGVAGPLLVLDIHDEYDALPRRGLGDFFSIDWENQTSKFRVVPSSSVDVSQAEGEMIFRHLTMFQERLSHWVFVIEEAHRFKDSSIFRGFLAEARKHTRKVLVVSAQTAEYVGLGRIYRVA